MYYLLFIICLFACCCFISRNRFTGKAGISLPVLNGLFIFKVAVGVFVGWFTKDEVSDSWGYNTGSLTEYNRLVSAPGQFFYDFIRPHYMTWHDLPDNIILRLSAVLDIFSRGNYYINSMFFVLAGFAGSVALYRVFRKVYPLAAAWQLVAGCFLLPSLLIFTSLIHKDAIVFCMLGLFCHALYFSLREKLTLKRMVTIIISLAFITLIRNYVMIALLPCSLAFILAEKTRMKPWLAFAAVYTVAVILLLVIQLAAPSSTPLKLISAKQAEFFSLPVARSQVATDTIYPTLQSLAGNSPQAFSHTLMEPYFFQFGPNFVMNLFALEMHAYFLLFLLMLLFYKRRPAGSFTLYAVMFGLTLFLVMGYIVPNMGAITRYRSIFLPLLITPILCHINWQKIKSFLHIKF
ncbi:hypothetical protein [Ferruginibacter sp. HRS2-29]|uniref:hypothetical protein n=1 Tax=Ferruginibacter sp. HRS2-29 TaxID=2487334 RepID=UPI0020CCDD7D|nr:hypothetical protein [Ferruginibacter sp. HRS2-29]